MIKRLLALFLAVICCCGIVGCSSSNESESTPETEGKVNITLGDPVAMITYTAKIDKEIVDNEFTVVITFKSVETGTEKDMVFKAKEMYQRTVPATSEKYTIEKCVVYDTEGNVYTEKEYEVHFENMETESAITSANPIVIGNGDGETGIPREPAE